MGRKKDNSEPKWTAKVTFVPFESEIQREQAYRNWVRMFLKGKGNNKKKKGKSEKTDFPSNKQV